MATKTKQVVENQLISNNKETQLVENQQVKLSKIEKLEKSIKIGLSNESNKWQKLLAISSNAKLEMFSLSKIVKTFIESSTINGVELLTDKQKSLLTFERVKNVVLNTEKYKDKRLYSLHDVVLICNRILTENDKSIRLAKKVTKQGGTITTAKK